ncbi:terminase large subunit [Rhodococcus pyridinivorans]|uniref:PBSX family phage terminase large subunit n=1 Tax=Rhodococcus pyridinivorans TaxID=103816 RepID=UPI00280BAD84|nr:terminase large subunit [Rhodococcus pyridinivorans]WMM74457.1 terminase large subunit [Rhodococcus pyridinivorans]
MAALLKQTTALTKISSLRRRLRIIQGGTSASKTFSILAYLIHTAQSNANLLISVVSESLPHLKLGAIRDFKLIMKMQKYWDENAWSKGEFIYNFPNGSMIEFFSVDSSKAHGPRRDVLFLNECNNVTYEVYTQLETRTRKLVILDFNPVATFWVHEQVMPHNPHDFLKLTYKDNEALEPAIVRSIESRKHNTNYWRVYGLGEVGVLEGQIYPDWLQIDEIPEEARLRRRGLDFGYTNHPTGLVDVYEWNDAYILDEQLYRTGMKNPQIATFIQGLHSPETLVIADSAEPKSIDDISDHGVPIVGAEKGADSIRNGIDAVQFVKVYMTKRSVNLIKEQRNYVWKTDRTGKALNEPIDLWNHLLDAARYALVDLIGNPIQPFPGDDEAFGPTGPYTSGILDQAF